jgi:hypothetical protein
MSFLTNLWADLVDKRLWPVLVALVVALVAIPLLLLKSSGDGSRSTAPVPPAAAASDAQAVVAVDGTAIPGVRLRGSSRDPFRGRGLPPGVASTSSPGPGPAAPGPSTGAPTGSAGSGAGGISSPGGTGVDGTGSGSGGGAPSSGSSPGTSGSGPPSSPSQPPVIVRFGKAGASAQRRVVAPLEALPSHSNPVVVYLGDHGGKAEFLVSSDVVPSGQVTCKPSKEVCQKAYIAPGHTVSLDAAGTDGNTQYVIEVLSAGS